MAKGAASPLNSITAESLWPYDGGPSVGGEPKKQLQQVGCPPDWQGFRGGSGVGASQGNGVTQ
jgi:hypothetical protein